MARTSTRATTFALVALELASAGCRAAPEAEAKAHRESASASSSARPPAVGGGKSGAALDDRAAAYRAEIEARLGRPVHLTLNPELQAAVRAAVKATGKVAAVTVIDVQTGAIRAAYSELDKGVDPLVSAVVPGCTFKPVLALAGLERGLLQEETEYVCQGEYRAHDQSFKDFDKHGPMTLRTALATSCDTFFIRIAHQLGAGAVERHARHFGFGEATGVELREELGALPAVAPDAGQKRGASLKKEIDTSTGHGAFRATPLQIARAYAAIASGRLVPLHLTETSAPPPAGTALPYTPEHLAAVRKGLSATVQESIGTAHNVVLADLEFAGKTGSIWEDDGGVLGLFGSYAPAESPRVAVVGLVRKGRRATFSAAPLVSRVLDSWHKLQQAPAAKSAARP